jgi:uncharacterized membrane protein YvbJ
MKQCPFCAEKVQAEAIVCKHCGSKITPEGWLENRETQALKKVSTNGLAVASMICALVWAWGLGSLLGLIFGYSAKKQISGSKGSQVGGGMATAGIVIGWIGCIGSAFFLLVLFVGSFSS